MLKTGKAFEQSTDGSLRAREATLASSPRLGGDDEAVIATVRSLRTCGARAMGPAVLWHLGKYAERKRESRVGIRRPL